MLNLRRATTEDEARLLAWRNEPAVRAASFTSEVVAPDEHHAWLTRKLSDSNSFLFIVEQNGTPIGQVRLDAFASQEAEISIALAAAARGKGLGRQAIRLALAELPDEVRVVRALVKRDNLASVAAFAAAGFVIEAETARTTTLTRRL